MSAIAAASSGRARRACMALLAGGRRDELRDRGDLGGGERPLERRHDAAADLDLMLDDRLAPLQLVEVRADVAGRAGGRERVAARAFRLEDRLAVVAELRRRLRGRLAGAGDGGDVGR